MKPIRRSADPPPKSPAPEAKWARRARNLSRESWIAAARDALVQEGIAAVKVERLARTLGVSRGGFYWRFVDHQELLDALLSDWERTNTGPWLAVLSGPGSPAERFQALAMLWIDERDYSPDYDRAVRSWSLTSPVVAEAVHRVDDRRIDALQALFVDAGYPEPEAFVRARITYFHQVGYYAMGIKETRERRTELSALYFRILTGLEPAPAPPQTP